MRCRLAVPNAGRSRERVENAPQAGRLNSKRVTMPIQITENPDGAISIRIKVVPGSSRDRIVGELGDELKIAVSKPPQDGAANAAVVALLSKQLGISKNQIQIVRGHSNPHKELLIAGLSPAALRERLKIS
jgi:uncharacterized protein (TIGR00251 family)